MKVRILEAKQTLEECISAQDFSRAAKLKDSITDLEDRRNHILAEIEESSQGADKEVPTEKVPNSTKTFLCFCQGDFKELTKRSFSFARMTQKLS